MALNLLELLLLGLAWSAVLAVRPWRLLQDGRLATPLLASLAIVPWLWSWPGLAALPIALHWSGAPLLVLVLGWPLAVPVLTVAGLSTLFTTDAGAAQALSLTVWSGILPATAALALGHVVRRASGNHPVGYLLGRGFLVPLAALAGCALLGSLVAPAPDAPLAGLHRLALLLLAMGEASWTCAIASLLVGYRPQWLATWSDPLYLGRPEPARVRARRPPPRR